MQKYGKIFDIEEQPDSPQWDISWEGTIITRTYECANLQTLLANKPELGSTYSDLPENMTVSNVVISPTAGKARMVVKVRTNTSGASVQVTNPTYERDWLSQSFPIEKHPAFNTGGIYALSETDWYQIDAWKSLSSDGKLNSEDKKIKAIASLSDNAKQLATRLSRNITSYDTQIPVIRETSNYTGGAPGTSGTGFIESPPPQSLAPAQSANGFTYHYVRMVDRAVQTARGWARYREWYGYPLIDSTLINNT